MENFEVCNLLNQFGAFAHRSDRTFAREIRNETRLSIPYTGSCSGPAPLAQIQITAPNHDIKDAHLRGRFALDTFARGRSHLEADRSLAFRFEITA